MYKSILNVICVALAVAVTAFCVGCVNPASDDDGGIKMYTLTTAVTGGGYVSRSPDQTHYTKGEYVTVTATPLTGYVFASWSGASNSTSPSVTIVVDGNKTLTANFTQAPAPTYTLTTNKSPSAGGSVSVIPDNISYTAGEQVTVTATPNADYSFTGWSGASTSKETTVAITMDGNKTLTANFARMYTLTTSASPATGGGVSVSPNKTSYVAGEQVTVTANANANYAFTGWQVSGASIGSPVTEQATFTINNNVTLTALFEQKANAVVITLTSFSTSEKDLLNGPDPRIHFVVSSYLNGSRISSNQTGLLFNQDNISSWTGSVQSSQISFANQGDEVRIYAVVMEADDVSANDDISPSGYYYFNPIPASGTSGSATLQKGTGKSTVGFSYRFLVQ